MPELNPTGKNLEIGHVLFVDVVGYSKMFTNEQKEKVERLNQVVRATDQFQSAVRTDQLMMLPTGDGMILVFFTTPDAPVRCAIAVSRALKTEELPLRMGIHSGPVERIKGVDGRENLAGAGVRSDGNSRRAR